MSGVLHCQLSDSGWHSDWESWAEVEGEGKAVLANHLRKPGSSEGSQHILISRVTVIPTSLSLCLSKRLSMFPDDDICVG